jgi:predicted DNA-binding transcriptional regulator AlpA
VTARGAAAPTLAQLKKKPPTLSVDESAPFIGVSRSTAYEAIRLGTFPVRTIRVSRRIRVITASLIAVLEDGEAVR